MTTQLLCLVRKLLAIVAQEFGGKQDGVSIEFKLNVQWKQLLKWIPGTHKPVHYSDVIMGAMASQITCVSIVYSTAWSGADEIKHQSSASLAFVRGIHRSPVNSPHKRPATRKLFPFDDVIMINDDDQEGIHTLMCGCAWCEGWGDIVRHCRSDDF